MSDELIRLAIEPDHYEKLLALVESRIRSERARARAFRSRGDDSNAMMADCAHDSLLNLRSAMIDAAEGGRSDG